MTSPEQAARRQERAARDARIVTVWLAILNVLALTYGDRLGLN